MAPVRMRAAKRDCDMQTNEMRMAKFEILMENIAWDIYKYLGDDLWQDSLPKREDNWDMFEKNPLHLIFEKDDLNEYGVVIMRKAKFRINDYKTHSFDSVDIKEKIAATKDFIGISEHVERCAFVFWSLMVLSVDDTNADEKLSLICDFARMFKITDDELIDIANVIRIIFHEIDKKDYAFKTEYIATLFREVLSLY